MKGTALSKKEIEEILELGKQNLGTKEICDGVQEFFGSDVKLAQRYPERNVNNYTLAYCGNISIKNKLDILYEDASIYLERKFKLWEELNEFLNKH